MRWTAPVLLAALLLAGCAVPAAPSAPGAARTAAEAPRGELVAALLRTLDRQIPDLPLSRGTREELRARGRAARNFTEERAVAQSIIERIPASHIALYSDYAKAFFEGELAGRDAPTLGILLAGIGGELYVARVTRGTPAEAAGIRRGDRLLAIGGFPAAASPRLDPRHDDAALPDEAAHALRVWAGERVTLRLARGGEGAAAEIEVELPVTVTSALRADRAGVRMVEREGARVGVIPFTYVYERGAAQLLLDALAGRLAPADALVLDLRGRGGSAMAVVALVALLRDPAVTGGRPVVAAIDRRTRSAKEVIARDLRVFGIGTLVGERTAGAVRPARWLPLVEGTWLLCPRGRIAAIPDGLEGSGVAPDIAVEDPFPGGDGVDPILESAVTEAARQAALRRAAAAER